MISLKINIRKTLIIFFFLFVFFNNFALAQETQNINQNILSSNNEEFLTKKDLIQFQQDSIWQLATTNLGYLAIAIAIILFFGGLIYFLNLKPLENKIENTEKLLNEKFDKLVDKQTKEIETQNNQISKKSEELKGTIDIELSQSKEKIETLEVEIKKDLKILKNQYKILEFSMDWNQHYVWDMRNVYINALMCLVKCLETIKENKIFAVWTQLVLEETEVELNSLIKSGYSSEENDKDYFRLLTALESIDGFEAKKTSIKDKAKTVFTK